MKIKHNDPPHAEGLSVRDDVHVVWQLHQHRCFLWVLVFILLLCLQMLQNLAQVWRNVLWHSNIHFRKAHPGWEAFRRTVAETSSDQTTCKLRKEHIEARLAKGLIFWALHSEFGSFLRKKLLVGSSCCCLLGNKEMFTPNLQLEGSTEWQIILCFLYEHKIIYRLVALKESYYTCAFCISNQYSPLTCID